MNRVQHHPVGKRRFFLASEPLSRGLGETIFNLQPRGELVREGGPRGEDAISTGLTTSKLDWIAMS